MRLRLLLLFILVIFLYSSCSKKLRYLEKKTKRCQYDVTCLFEEIEILTFDSLSYRIYDVDNAGENLLILNDCGHKLGRYNLNDRVFKEYKLLKPNANFTKINSIDYHGVDSVFLFTKDVIYFMTDSIVWMQSIHEEGGQMTLSNLGSFPSRYDASQNCFFIQSFSSSYNQANDLQFYKLPIEYSLHFEAKIPLKLAQYSPLLRSDFYGFSNSAHRLRANKKSYYTFPIDPNIYVLDHQTRDFKILGGKSKYQRKRPKAIPKGKLNDTQYKFSAMVENIYYDQLLFDPFRNVFYRFFLQDIEEIKEDGKFNTFGDKPLVLMIFNDDFELLKEIYLGKHKYNPAKSFVGKEGLYISKAHYKNKNYNKNSLKFDLMKLEL